jgi:hypothetical protein
MIRPRVTLHRFVARTVGRNKRSALRRSGAKAGDAASLSKSRPVLLPASMPACRCRRAELLPCLRDRRMQVLRRQSARERTASASVFEMVRPGR